MFRSVMTAVGILAISATAFAAQTAPAAPAKPKAAVVKTTKTRGAWASGEISRYDAASKTLVVKQGASEQTFVVADNARIMEGKKTMAASDLTSSAGHKAKVRYRASGSTRTVDRVEIADATTTATASAKPAAKPAKKG